MGQILTIIIAAAIIIYAGFQVKKIFYNVKEGKCVSCPEDCSCEYNDNEKASV